MDVACGSGAAQCVEGDGATAGGGIRGVCGVASQETIDLMREAGEVCATRADQKKRRSYRIRGVLTGGRG